jgi:hypothetical protein
MSEDQILIKIRRSSVDVYHENRSKKARREARLFVQLRHRPVRNHRATLICGAPPPACGRTVADIRLHGMRHCGVRGRRGENARCFMRFG